MKFDVHILGAQAALPTTEKAATAQLINHNDRFFLIDCAEGTQRLLRKYKLKFQRIKHIFISHLHGDHFLGMPGLLSSFQLLGRQQKLFIYAPPDFQMFFNTYQKISNLNLSFEVEIIPLKKSKSKELIVNDKWLNIYAFPVEHRIDCWGFHFEEKPKYRKVIPEAIQKHAIPNVYGKKLQKGEDYINPETGQSIANEKLTHDPDSSYSYTYMTDTLFMDNVQQYIDQTDVLYHEATFAQDMLKRAEETYHSTAEQAAQIAHKLKASKLILGHFSARYRQTVKLQNEAEKLFSNVHCAKDGEKLSIP